MPLTWPKTIVFGYGGVRPENCRKTGFAKGEIAKGFWPPVETGQRSASSRSLRPSVHA